MYHKMNLSLSDLEFHRWWTWFYSLKEMHTLSHDSTLSFDSTMIIGAINS